MGQPIIHHDGWFFVWSTVCDAPISMAMREDDFRQWMIEEYGRTSAGELQARILRAKQNGTSLYDHTTAEEFLAFNRAGKNESCLSFEGVLKSVGAQNQP